MYKFEDSKRSVRDFISLYGNALPLTAVVSEGFMGNSDRETFAYGQVLRLQAIKTATRVSGKIIEDKEGRYRHNYSISLPITPDIFVRKIKGNNNTVSIESLARGKLPCKVRLVEKCVVLKDEQQLCIDQSVTLLLEQTTQFRYIVGCPVSGVDLLKHTIILPDFVDKIRLSLALGVEGLNQSQWVQLQAYMNDVMHRFFVFDDNTYLQGIHLYSEYEFNFCLPIKQRKDSAQTTTQVYEPLQQKDVHDNVYEILPNQTDDGLAMQSQKWKKCLQESPKTSTIEGDFGQHENKTMNFKERQSPPTLPARPIKRTETTEYESIDDYSAQHNTKMANYGKAKPTSFEHQRQTRISPNETSIPNQKCQENKVSKGAKTLPLVLPQKPPHNNNPLVPESHTCITKQNHASSRDNNSVGINQTATKEYNPRLPETKAISVSGINKYDSTMDRPSDNKDISHMYISDVGELLSRLNLQKYIEQFSEAQVDGVILQEFDDTAFDEFGLSRVERIKLTKFIQCGHVPK